MGRRKILDRLTRDSISAEKAGMSYGKWKVLHPHTEEKVEVLDADVKLCEICGEPIPSRRRKYCSIECSIEANVIKNREFKRMQRERMMANGKI